MISKDPIYRISSIDEFDSTTPANCTRSCIYAGGPNKEIFESLCKVINSLDNTVVSTQLSIFCNCLAHSLYDNSYLDKLPEILYEIESDEVFLEWIFRDFRLGFLFCEDVSESGWDIVIDTPDGVRSKSTKFNGDIPSALSEAVSYMMRIS